MLVKDGDGYHMSDRGRQIMLYTLLILDNESDHKNEVYWLLIEKLSAQVGIIETDA